MLAARRPGWARNYLIIGGIVYLVLLAYGLIVDQTSSANFVPLDDADDWLHLALGVGMIVLGLLVPGVATARRPNRPRTTPDRR